GHDHCRAIAHEAPCAADWTETNWPLLFVSLVLIYPPVIHSCSRGSLSFGEYVTVCLWRSWLANSPLLIMPKKSILIFSDGTGQAGGVTFDENRTNIYKLFRATRCGPDSPINPAEQVAFYDPGLGSPRDNHFTFGWIGRKIYNSISQGTGF